jgi:nucleoside-diphosphate-sugar epimerase
VVVNILTNLAYHKREISIFGGDQLRPNIHIKDMVEAYMVLLNAPKEKIAGKIYNAGYENHSVKDIAQTVKDTVGDDVKLVTSHSDDNRSYHISSLKIKTELGFEAKHTIRDAVEDLCQAFDKNLLPNSLDDEMYFNIKRMNNLEIN